METWNVKFSYNIMVEASTMEDAEAEAREKWGEIAPRQDEMNVEVSKYQE